MKMKLFMGISAIVLVAVFILVYNQSSDSPFQEVSEDIKSFVADYSANSTTAEAASITSHELIVTSEDEKQTMYSLPEDEFFVSIAPYIEVTHPCAIHSLTGCQGELVEEEMHVIVIDSEGNTVIDQEMTTLENGFVDLWLPRNDTYQIKIEHNGLEVESEITTFEEDNTCITTMQLN